MKPYDLPNPPGDGGMGYGRGGADGVGNGGQYGRGEILPETVIFFFH